MHKPENMTSFYEAVQELENRLRGAGFVQYAHRFASLWKGCYTTSSEFLDFVDQSIDETLKDDCDSPRRLDPQIIEHMRVLKEFIRDVTKQFTEQGIHTSELEAKGISTEELFNKGVDWAKRQPYKKHDGQQ